MPASLIRRLLLTAVLAGTSIADFHLMQSSGANVPNYYFSCPSNYYKSNCWCSGDRRSSEATIGKASNGEYKVTLDKVCGVAAMDFWYRPKGISGDDRVRFEAYIPNADGHVVATCYSNGGGKTGTCSVGFPTLNTVYDGYVCYSTICGSA